MKDFAELLDRLAYTPSRNDKLRLLADYFAATPDPDRGFALAALSDGLFFRLPVRRILAELLGPRVDPVLFDLSRDYVGDTAETIALIWPGGTARSKPPRLAALVEALQAAPPTHVPALLANWLDQLDATGRWALLKLMTGALRVGVSARLAKTALAEWSGVALADIEEVWHGLSPPYEELVRLAVRHRSPPRHGRPGDVPAADAVASDRGQGVAVDRGRGFRRRVEMGRDPRAGGPSGRREAAVLAHRRRHLRRLSRCGRGPAGRRGARRRAAGGAEGSRSPRSTISSSGSTARP